jgi:uncharacterized damage-inducible protein DinB
VLPEKTRYYLLEGLSAAPTVMAHLLRGATDAELDRRPDPARFTLREVIAHLADWDPIWLERLTDMRDRDRPPIKGYDEGQLALDHDYARADAGEQLALFRERRERLLAFFKELRPEQWDRQGVHSEYGLMSISDWAAQILGHDGYHLRQSAEWLGLSGAGE